LTATNAGGFLRHRIRQQAFHNESGMKSVAKHTAQNVAQSSTASGFVGRIFTFGSSVILGVLNPQRKSVV
jgi:hypothetical protein